MRGRTPRSNVMLGCAGVFAALGLVIQGNVPPPPELPPEPPAEVAPDSIIRPALQLDTMEPANETARRSLTV